MTIDGDDESELFAIAASFGGGVSCERALSPLDRLLTKTLHGYRASDYLDGLARFEFWLYFGGTILDYKGESGPRRLAMGRKPPRLIIDLRVARSDYEGKTQEQTRQLLADGVEACFELMLQRALKRKAVKDEAKFRADFGAAMQRFRTEPIKDHDVVDVDLLSLVKKLKKEGRNEDSEKLFEMIKRIDDFQE